MAGRPTLPRVLVPTSTSSLTSLDTHVKDTFKVQLFNPDDPRSPQSEEELRQRLLGLLAEVERDKTPAASSGQPLDTSVLASYPPAPPPPAPPASSDSEMPGRPAIESLLAIDASSLPEQLFDASAATAMLSAIRHIAQQADAALTSPASSATQRDSDDDEEYSDDDDDEEEEEGSSDDEFDHDDGIAPAPFDLKAIDQGRNEVRERRKWERFQERLQQERDASELRQAVQAKQRPVVERTPEQMLQQLRDHVQATRELQARQAELQARDEAAVAAAAAAASDVRAVPSELAVAELGCSEAELVRATQHEAASIVENLPRVEAAAGSLEAEIIEAAFWIRMKRLARLADSEQPAAARLHDTDEQPHLASQHAQRSRYLHVLETMPIPEADDDDDDNAPVDPAQLYQQFRSLFPAMCSAASSRRYDDDEEEEEEDSDDAEAAGFDDGDFEYDDDGQHVEDKDG